MALKRDFVDVMRPFPTSALFCHGEMYKTAFGPRLLAYGRLAGAGRRLLRARRHEASQRSRVFSPRMDLLRHATTHVVLPGSPEKDLPSCATSTSSRLMAAELKEMADLGGRSQRSNAQKPDYRCTQHHVECGVKESPGGGTPSGDSLTLWKTRLLYLVREGCLAPSQKACARNKDAAQRTSCSACGLFRSVIWTSTCRLSTSASPREGCCR